MITKYYGTKLIGEGQLFPPPDGAVTVRILPVGFPAIKVPRWFMFPKSKLEDIAGHWLHGGPTSSWPDPSVANPTAVPKELLQLLERGCLNFYKPPI